jgi:hypothetical protein
MPYSVAEVRSQVLDVACLNFFIIKLKLGLHGYGENVFIQL